MSCGITWTQRVADLEKSGVAEGEARLALGAKQWSTIWLVLRDALMMIISGIGIELPFVWLLGRLVQAQLYEVSPSDPAALAAAMLVLCAATIVAALIPARRASAIDPTEALRVE